jgi:hypothetical protein
MKKLFCFLFAAFAIFVIPFALFGQTTPPPGDVVTLPTLPVTFDIKAYVATFFYFAATVVFLTSVINKFIKLKGFAKQYLSWFVALAIGISAFLLKLGIFEPIHWYQALIYSIAAGLGANGIFDWNLIQTILQAIKLEPTPPVIAAK